LQLIGVMFIAAMAGSASYAVWCYNSERSEWRFYFEILLATALAMPATALLAVWLSADLTRAQRWKLTQKMSIGFSAYENAFRYLLTGGRHSDGPRT
jgi:hypothetical protein